MREKVVSKTIRDLNDPVWEFSEKHLYMEAIWHLGETVGIINSEFHGVWTPSNLLYEQVMSLPQAAISLL